MHNPAIMEQTATLENARPVLVLGATGYVGGRLIPELLARGMAVRAAVRSPKKILCRPFANHPGFSAIQADVLNPDSLAKAAEGCRAAYYLVHSMQKGAGDYASVDRRAAENAVIAFARAGLGQVVYLGGLGEEGDDLSQHLRSRMEVGRILKSGDVPLTWLRAAMILGSGSASFEIMRYLVDRLPLMIVPRWVQNQCQPIAVGDVVAYLAGCLDNLSCAGRRFDIGGPDILSYERLFEMYAEEAGLPRRPVIGVPLFTPWLSSHWIGLITPVPAALAKPLAEGLKNTVICRDLSIRDLVPVELTPCRQAIRLALSQLRQGQVASCWHDAGEHRVPEWTVPGDPAYAGGSLRRACYAITLAADPRRLWECLAEIGGDDGWYYGDGLWAARGLLDKLAGGPGHLRGRRHPKVLLPGDALGLFRVVEADPPLRLLLAAEMKLPGEAVLEFALAPGQDGTRLSVSALFRPRGLSGMAYWWAMAPFHALLFRGLLKALARRIKARVIAGPTPFSPESGSCALPDRG